MPSGSCHSFFAGVSAGVTALYNKKSGVSVVPNRVNPVLPRGGGLEGGVDLGEMIKLIVQVLDDVLHLNRGEL